MVVFLSKECEVVHNRFSAMYFSPQIFFLIKKFLNGLKRYKSNQDYVVNAAELPTSAFVTRLLSGIKCEVVLHHAEASIQWLIVLVSFV
jgi:hypothetical protein